MENVLIPVRFEKIRKLIKDAVWISKIVGVFLLTPFALLMVFLYLATCWVVETYQTLKLFIFSKEKIKDPLGYLKSKIKQLSQY